MFIFVYFTNRSSYEFYVYTMESNGLLLSSNMKQKFDYEVLYMLDGKVYYLFNAGAGELKLTSSVKVNDGKLHLIKTSRVKRKGAAFFISVKNMYQATGG